MLRAFPHAQLARGSGRRLAGWCGGGVCMAGDPRLLEGGETTVWEEYCVRYTRGICELIFTGINQYCSEVRPVRTRGLLPDALLLSFPSRPLRACFPGFPCVLSPRILSRLPSRTSVTWPRGRWPRVAPEHLEVASPRGHVQEHAVHASSGRCAGKTAMQYLTGRGNTLISC